MSRCTAPVRGHRTASAAADCPACGGRGYEYSPRSYYPPPAYTPRSSSGGGTSSGGGSISGRTRPSWSPSSSAVTYTPAQVRALTPVRRTVELRARQDPDLRDVFLCHVLTAASDDDESVTFGDDVKSPRVHVRAGLGVVMLSRSSSCCRGLAGMAAPPLCALSRCVPVREAGRGRSLR